MSASSSADAARVPTPPEGVKTTLLVVTKDEHIGSNPLRRLLACEGAMPEGRFDVHVGTKLEDFPRDVLDSAAGGPVALLWWFGEPHVLGEILRSKCARPDDTPPTSSVAGAATTPTAAASAAPAQRGRVAWVHSGSAGVEHILEQPEVREGAVPLTNAKGAFSASLGEWAIFGCMWFAKKVNAMRKSQAAGRWMRDSVGMLQGKTMSIVGYGDIGRACAQRAKALGMRVVALRRNPQRSSGDLFVDEMLPLTALHDAMATGDFVVLSLPHTPQTEGLVDAAAIARMKPSGVLVNVGRGAVVDEPALVEALRRGAIAGAALDVFVVEPLPEGHALYSLENCLMSFHCADLTDDYFELTMDTFMQHAKTYVEGGGAWNVVDKSAGY